MDHYLKRQVLHRAMQIAGGHEALCAALELELHALGLWLAGKALIPDRVFDAALEMVLKDDIARSLEDRRQRPRVERPTRTSA